MGKTASQFGSSCGSQRRKQRRMTRSRRRAGARRRTAPGRSAGCASRRGCRCVPHRWRSPAGRGQIPTGRICRLRGGDARRSRTRRCAHQHTRRSHAFIRNTLTFKEPVDDLKAGAQVRQRELVELCPTLGSKEGVDEYIKMTLDLDVYSLWL